MVISHNEISCNWHYIKHPDCHYTLLQSTKKESPIAMTKQSSFYSGNRRRYCCYDGQITTFHGHIMLMETSSARSKQTLRWHVCGLIAHYDYVKILDQQKMRLSFLVYILHGVIKLCNILYIQFVDANSHNMKLN